LQERNFMPIDTQSLCLITGAGTGIGRGIALALARRKAVVGLVGRRSAYLEQVGREVAALGGTAHCFQSDLTNSEQRILLVEQIRREFGPLKTLIHNAGVLHGGSFLTQNPDELEQMIQTNLVAPLLLTRAFAADLIAQHGQLVVVGSNTGRAPMPGLVGYSTSKAGLHMMIEALRYELAPHGVQLLLVIPPGTTTPMTKSMQDHPASRFYRSADPDRVGEQIVAALEAGKTKLAINGGDRILAAAYRWMPALIRRVLTAQRTMFIEMMGRRNG
jgi:short-subunit dehydrogenase